MSASHPAPEADQPLLSPPTEFISLQPDIATDQTVTLDERKLRKRVLNLAWPVIGENFLETFLGIIDTLLVARLGAEAIAGVGSAIQVMFFVIAALSALAVGSAVLVAQAYGAGELGRAGQLARQSMIWSILLSIPLALVGVFFAGPIIRLFGMEPAVTQIGIDYLVVTMGTAVVLTGLLIGGGVLRGAGDARTPMVVRAIANVVNVGLAYGLIFGHFGLPAMGAVGSAWGTFLARTLALILMIWAMWQGRNGVSIRGEGTWWPDFKVARQVLSIGIPAAVEQVLISAAFFAMTIVVAGLGTLTMAAHRIAMNAMSLSFLPGIGFALAATTLVGQSIGARNRAEGAASARIATNWSLIWMTGMGAVLFFLAAPIIQIFSNDAQVIAIGAAGLKMVALAQPFWAIFFVQSGALRGTGDTKFPLRVNATGIWISVLLAYILMQFFEGSLTLVWLAFLVVAPVMAWILWWRFRQAIAEQPYPEL